MSDLTTPLGVRTPGGDRKRRPIGVIASVAVVGLAAGVAIWMIAVDDPFGGEPTAVAKIEDVNGSVGRDEVTVVGVKSGSGRILTGDGDGAAEAVAEVAPAPSGPAPRTVADAGAMPTVAIEELLETTPAGPIPRIAEDGTRPLDAYARPVADMVGAAPRIAVVVGGLGLSQTGTQEALRQLPPDVTLAFAPYGSSLDRWTARARQEGHELLLQIPLEPFDYPDNDPGPHTLVTGATVDKNRENLHWLMARIGPYVGVMGYMGARFTSETGPMEPVMAELARRGLMYVDDASSSRSRAAEAAAAGRTPFAGADLVIDQVAGEAEIQSRLAQLEQIARTRGVAVGVASALPVSVRSIGEWAATLERRGIALVPVSATLGQR